MRTNEKREEGERREREEKRDGWMDAVRDESTSWFLASSLCSFLLPMPCVSGLHRETRPALFADLSLAHSLLQRVALLWSTLFLRPCPFALRLTAVALFAVHTRPGPPAPSACLPVQLPPDPFQCLSKTAFRVPLAGRVSSSLCATLPAEGPSIPTHVNQHTHTPTHTHTHTHSLSG